MKSLFNSAENKEMIKRINALNPESKRGWGTMNASQMLSHVQAPLMVAFGELTLKRSLAGYMFGRIAKWKLASDRQWKRGLPTDKNFVVSGQRNFDEEKGKLILLVQRFTESGPAAISKQAHPFFGNLTVDEWDKLMWNHLDHHLRQFGA